MLAYSTVAELRLRLSDKEYLVTLRGVKFSRGSVRRNCLTFLQVTLKTLLKHYPDARLAVDAQTLEVQSRHPFTPGSPAGVLSASMHRPAFANRSAVAVRKRSSARMVRAHTHEIECGR